MRISDILSETGPNPTPTTGQQIKTNLGFSASAGAKGMLGTMALKGLGLKNTAQAFGQNKGVLDNPLSIAQSLQLKPGANVDLGQGQKAQIKSIDQKGVTFADGTIWGPEKLATLSQQQQALQTLSQQKPQ